MSTKIYNGFELRGFSLESALATFVQLRPSVNAIVEEEHRTMMVRMAVVQHDRKLLSMGGSSPLDTSLMEDAYRSMVKRQRDVRVQGLRDPMIDWSFEVVVFSFEGRVFGMLYTEHQVFRDMVGAIPGYAEFGYWDNTDMPEEIEELEWMERERIWNGILGEDGIPGRVGYTYTFSSTEAGFAMPSSDVVDACVLSVAVRVDNMFLQYLEMLLLARIPAECTGPYSVYSWLKQFANTEEGRGIRDRVTALFTEHAPTSKVLFYVP